MAPTSPTTVVSFPHIYKPLTSPHQQQQFLLLFFFLNNNITISTFCLAPPKCHRGQFECALSHKCIPSGWMCDGENDCGTNDTSDEDQLKCMYALYICLLFSLDQGFCIFGVQVLSLEPFANHSFLNFYFFLFIFNIFETFISQIAIPL